MSDYFVADAPVPIYEFDPGSREGEDGKPLTPNVIYIRPRMNVETRNRVAAAGKPNTKGVMDDPAENLTALLIFNIVRWEGPNLGQIPCTPENIRRLDPNKPHIEEVFNEIARRNTPKESPDPKLAEPSGSMSAGATASSIPSQAEGSRLLPSAPGISKYPSPSGLDGRLNKSEDLTPIT